MFILDSPLRGPIQFSTGTPISQQSKKVMPPGDDGEQQPQVVPPSDKEQPHTSINEQVLYL